MAQNKELLSWSHVLSAVLDLPGVKVNRVAFLRKELKAYCSASKLDMLDSVRPYTIVSDRVIDAVAQKCINRHTTLATAASTIAGLPGGLAMAATIPGDITQYYFHVVVLSQKLAYLYGFPDFCDEEGQLSEMTSDLLTAFMGAMMGVKVADQGISELAKGMARQAVGRLPRVAITKTAVYPVASTIARVAGMKLTKEGFAKGLGKFIPIAGGLFSGSLTLFTFKPGARRLQKRMKAQKMHFTDGDIDALSYHNIKASFSKAEISENRPEDKQLAVIQAMINLANINGAVKEEKFRLIEEKVAKADLDDNVKLELLGNVGTEESRENDFCYEVDYDLLACDPDYAADALHSLIAVAHASHTKPTVAERMFLTMGAKALGIDKETLDEWMAKDAESDN
ncbi:MAG: tellurite resistance TerB family protein [Prevotella sp.]|nr:tellurite resistance TerB family protein [Prevotella sp.]